MFAPTALINCAISPREFVSQPHEVPGTRHNSSVPGTTWTTAVPGTTKASAVPGTSGGLWCPLVPTGLTRFSELECHPIGFADRAVFREALVLRGTRSHRPADAQRRRQRPDT